MTATQTHTNRLTPFTRVTDFVILVTQVNTKSAEFTCEYGEEWMYKHTTRLLTIFCAVLATCSSAWSAHYVFPEDASIVNVKSLGAVGDGVTDDTNAIRKAVKAGIEHGRYATPAFVYFPKGTYLVTGPLESKVAEHGWSGGWRAGMLLVGEDMEKSVIRLKDNCPGYDNPEKPKWVVASGSESNKKTNPGDKPLSGGGNRAFRHSVINLTVNTGTGNPGATGIDYVASNRGTIEDVIIKSEDGAGYCGLRLERNWPGPAMVKRLKIDGFDYGMRVGHYQYSMTFEGVKFRNQKKAAVLNQHNCLFFRKVLSLNDVPFLVNTGSHGHAVLLDSTLKSNTPGGTAMELAGEIFMRNVTVENFDVIVAKRNKKGTTPQLKADTPASTTVEEWSSEVAMLFPSPKKSLNLPIKETPEFHTNDLAQWISVKQFENLAIRGAVKDKDGNETEAVIDWAPAIQAAIDSGKPVVYFPNGGYSVQQTVVVRGAAKKIMGFQSSLVMKGSGGSTLVAHGDAKDKMSHPALLRFEGGSSPFVVVEHMRLGGILEHASKQAVALRHADLSGYRNTPEGSGDMFTEDTIGGPWYVHHPQHFYARQLNCEFGDKPLVENFGATMWIFGYKTEGQMTCLYTKNGTTELLGAMFYPLHDAKKYPCILNENARVSMTFRMNGKDYSTHVKEIRNGETKTANSKQLAGRGPALYVGYPADGATNETAQAATE